MSSLSRMLSLLSAFHCDALDASETMELIEEMRKHGKELNGELQAEEKKLVRLGLLEPEKTPCASHVVMAVCY